jgi:DNA-binding MarR family transcriptional regulator
MVRDRNNFVKGLSATEVRNEDVDVTFMVWLNARATADLLDAALAPAGLDADEFAIYSLLTATGTITPTELARWMAAPPTTVSSYVKRFETRGHVQREPNPADRRSYRIRLTPAGRKTHRVAAELFGPISAAVSRGLGEKDGDVRETLLALLDVLEELRGARSGQPETPPPAVDAT